MGLNKVPVDVLRQAYAEGFNDGAVGNPYSPPGQVTGIELEIDADAVDPWPFPWPEEGDTDKVWVLLVREVAEGGYGWEEDAATQCLTAVWDEAYSALPGLVVETLDSALIALAEGKTTHAFSGVYKLGYDAAIRDAKTLLRYHF